MPKYLCIVKKTAYEHNTQNAETNKKYSLLHKSKRLNIEQNHKNHYKLLDSFQKMGEKLDMNIEYSGEEHIKKCNPQPEDVVLSFGGDGTFLSCARHFPNNLMLGINSDFRRFDSGKGSYGALTGLNFLSLEQGLRKMINGSYTIMNWRRLGVSLNNTPLKKLAVNDVFIGNRRSYLSSDLAVVYNHKHENFLCSGLIACTGMGSHAWYRTIGGTPFSNELSVFGFSVLMPNLKKRYQYTSGIVGAPEMIEVYPNRDDYVISFDSKNDVVPVEIGDVIQIYLSEHSPVNVIHINHASKN